MKLTAAFAVLALLGLSACASDEHGSATFTTSGQQLVELGIRAGAGGFVDGWSLKYAKFLVNFHQIQLATASGEVAQTSPASYFVDNVVPGSKQLVSFQDVTAKAWDRVSYQIKPAVASAVIVTGDSADLDMMVEAGYSIYIQGSASKGDVTKTFALGFTTGTQYDACHALQNGKDTAGIVVTDGAEDTSELTTHGAAFFHDRLPGSAAPSNPETSLRFAAFASADDAADADGAISLAELEDQPLDLELYDPSDLPAVSMRDFISGLARTVGHFRGTGECAISDAE